ncbi:MAG TPA: GlsB/YeaQ/YmgE family stress response membrane protein [Candidatus Saccharimonadales bacterium]|nr:GlsB/YeaQ/YmgE family stress response membrane protein [Candidatus Saccharimonadales bacterium]
MGFIAWIILGGLAGWIASLLIGDDHHMGVVANIIVGILGAFIGGFLVGLLGGSGVTGFNAWSLIVAVMGAVVLLLLVKAFRR